MKILIGISGGIAAYKMAGVVRHFAKRGDEVRVVMTRGASEFVAPLSLQIVSEHPVAHDLFDPTFESEIGHIELARWPDVILIAPATAHIIAKMAAGMADDLLTTILLATRAPVVVAPAMNTQMYRHPTVERNIATLKGFGYRVITPDSGKLACKEIGEGRLPDPPVLVAGVRRAVYGTSLAGKRVMVSAGPTRERIDAARFLSNPSTGKMGYAIAQDAWDRGAEVILVSGPTSLDVPAGPETIRVESALEMYDAIMARAESCDVIVKAAAVADWRPAVASERKQSKSTMTGSLDLVANPDILAELGRRFGVESTSPGPLLVGFGAESHDLLERGRAKLRRKGAHWLVVNAIGGARSAFASDDSHAWLLRAGEEDGAIELGPASKQEIAHDLWGALLKEGIFSGVNRARAMPSSMTPDDRES